MNLWKSIAGTYEIKIVGASTADTLSKLNDEAITLLNVIVVDCLTIHLTVYRYQYAIVKSILEGRGDCVSIVRKRGVFWTLQSLEKRPVLLVGMLMLLFFAVFLPTRVLFVRVDGNSNISSNQIIEKAETCGVKFGASRRHVRSEKVKNQLLDIMPDLQWAGVNTYGCVAVISVEERNPTEEIKEVRGVASLVARIDGIVSKMTVIRGNPICTVGQAVKAGQVLVSGYTDCGLCVRAEVAQGEVFAKTHHVVSVITPAESSKRTEIIKTEQKYSLLFGKKLIKFYKDSGISDSRCVKIYKEKYIRLPGGFHLPVAIITEQWVSYSEDTEMASEENRFLWINDYTVSYLKDQMISGEIQQQDMAGSLQNDAYILKGDFACVEMIGKIRSEEILQSNENRD